MSWSSARRSLQWRWRQCMAPEWCTATSKRATCARRRGGALKLTDWESGVPIGEVPKLHTRGYRAPEAERKVDRFFCEKSDMYSVGVVIRKWMDGLERRDGGGVALRDKWERVVEAMTAADVDERASVAEAARLMLHARDKMDASPTKEVHVESE
jgi:hypothetical protein